MNDSLIEYPCDFPIKVMGKETDAFREAATAIVERIAGPESAATAATRSSSGGRYVGLSFTVHVTSREQLDALYQALSDDEHVMVVL
ncbi:MAG: DUF493 domain-containing protein [Pseudomonadota bacterium]